MARNGRPKNSDEKAGDAKVVLGRFRARGSGAQAKRKRAPGEPPTKPAWITGLAAEIWDATVQDLQAAGYIHRMDAAGLASYCNAYARMIRAQAALDAAGSETYETHTKQGTMVRIRPEVKIVEACEKAIRAFTTDFGMSTAARKGLADPDQKDMFDHPDAEFVSTR